MNDLIDLLTLPSFRRSLGLLVVTGLTFPLVGVALLKLDLVPARFAVLHMAVLGATVAAGLGVPPLAGALLAAVVTGALVSRLALRSQGTPSGFLAAIMSVSLALAFAAASWFGLTAMQALALLWGDLLAATRIDAVAVLILAAVLLAGTVRFYKDIELITFSPRLARDLGYPVGLVYGAVVTVVCLAIAVAMRLTGALLVDGITVLPALAAVFVARSFRATLVWASVAGLVANLAGLLLAVAVDLPVSASIILCGFALVLVGYAARRRA